MKLPVVRVIPVLPSQHIERDITWYKENLNFQVFFSDNMYAILYRDEIVIHLQWHADTEHDPLLGGSVVRIELTDINPFFAELVEKGIVSEKDLKMNTPWHTNEFGLHDLNNNAIFILQSLK
jgi:hypothetical protein